MINIDSVKVECVKADRGAAVVGASLGLHKRMRAAGAITLATFAFTALADAQADTTAAVTSPAPQVAFATTQVDSLAPMDVHPGTSLSIVEQLRYGHFLQKPLDDSASSAMFDKYLDSLDPARAYFLAADVQAMEKYRYALDDALKRGDLQPAFEIFNRYQAQLVERLEFLIAELDQGLERMDFTLMSPWTSSGRTYPGQPAGANSTTSGASV
ncbi:MAG: hypothetical protein HC809_06730 [Gammaproteobacteria bacterium]|nr:hypothetical protein [Gammaproteobacteria bacterium]